MLNDFPKALPRILVYEGGKVDNPRDPGGRTNKGITQTTFNAYLRENGMPARDVYAITDDEVATIYKTKFWDTVHGDDLPAGLDLCVFDAGVNSGPGQAGKWLQRALGDKFVGAYDGLIGSKTLQAVEDFGDVETLINAFCARRLATLKSLRTWSTFGKGWSARVSNVMKTGDAWASNGAAPHPIDVTADGGHRKAPISDIKVSKISTITTHVTTATTSVGAIATSASSNLAPVQAAFPNFKYFGYILGGLAGISAISGLVLKLIADGRTAASAGTSTTPIDLDADAGHPQVAVNDAAPPAVNILQPKAP
jgi:lysozyme family protein